MQESADKSGRRRIPRTKISVPEISVRLVSRPRLLTTLDDGSRRRVTLIGAPAGYGKTLLLADWVRRRCPDATAWVSLDSDDNDDRRFWSAVLEALSCCPAVPADSPLHDLPVPARPSSDSRFLAGVVTALDELSDPVRLVLDDVQELTAQGPLRGLTALLRYRPEGLRFTVACREDPPLSLARLRLAGELTELHADELRFTPVEAGTLLTAADVGLAADERHRLIECTEGWAAGLGLAANALRGDATDPARLLADFAQQYRPMTEYLVHEVLSELAEDTREFLRTVSVCPLVSAELAAELSGRPDAGAVLAGLARDTSLVSEVRVRHRWFHLWAPIRSQLLADLNRQTPRQAAALHACAADWYAAHREPVLALDHAGHAADTDRLVRLLREDALPLAMAGEHATVRRAIDALPDGDVTSDGTLSLIAALLMLDAGDLAAADAYADKAEPTAANELLRRVVRSCRAQTTDDLIDQLPAAESLAVGADGPMCRTLAALHKGNALINAGDFAAAHTQLHKALADARTHGYDHIAAHCRIGLAKLAGRSGDFRRFTTWATQAYRDQLAHNWLNTIGGATARMQLAYGALLRAELDDCARHATRARPVLEASAPVADHGMSLVAACLVGTAEFGSGGWAAGLHRIKSARTSVEPNRVAPSQLALCAVLEHRGAVLLGMREAGRDVLDWAESWLPDCAELMVMRGRGQLAIRRHESARHAVAPIVHGHVRTLLPWTPIDVWLVETEAALQLGDRATAARCLARALSLAESSDVVFPLVFATPDVVDLLVERLGTFGDAEPRAQRVLAARRALRTSPVPLTERERAVLCLLPTLRSFEEIAADLTVSVNTVKTHVRAIYTKLGVGKRRDAVVVAEAQGLVEAIDVGPRIPRQRGVTG